MELGEVLSKAWKIIWRNKVLWIFGILSSCARGGGGGGGNSGGSNFNMPGNNGDFNFENGQDPFSNGEVPRELEDLGRNFENLFGNGDQVPWGLLIGLICGIIFLSLLFLFIQSIGRSGMIRGTMLADAGAGTLGFGEVWSAASPYFGKVFLFNFLIGLVSFVAVMILIVPLALIGVATMGIGLLCLIPLLCLLIPVGWAVNIWLEQSNVALVAENLGMIEALKRGWSVCRENLGPVAVVGLVIMVGGGIVGFIIAIPLMLVLIPVIIGGVSQDAAVMTGSMAVFGVMLCCLLPVIIALSGILQSYIDTSWTLTFLRLTNPKSKEPEILQPQPLIN